MEFRFELVPLLVALDDDLRLRVDGLHHGEGDLYLLILLVPVVLLAGVSEPMDDEVRGEDGREEMLVVGGLPFDLSQPLKKMRMK